MFNLIKNIKNIKTPLIINKNHLFTYHLASRKVLIETDSIIEYEHPYNNEIKCDITYSKLTNERIMSTFVSIHKLDTIDDVHYLDSYLSTFPKSFNIVKLFEPNLYNIYHYLTARNLYRPQNHFMLVNVREKYHNILPELIDINKSVGRNVWKLNHYCYEK